jgi:hypothetical protein
VMMMKMLIMERRRTEGHKIYVCQRKKILKKKNVQKK